MDDFAEKLLSEIEDFGIALGKNTERITQKCSSLCDKYGITSEDLVESWLAFAATKSIGELDEKGLDIFEKQNLSTRKESNKEKSFQNLSTSEFKTSIDSKVQVYGRSTTIDVDSENDMDQDGSDVLEVYGINPTYNDTPKAKKHSAMRLRDTAGDTPKSDFCLAGYSPAVESKSRSYGARTKAGDYTLRYKCKDSEYWNEIPANNQVVKVFPAHSTKDMVTSKEKFKYMFQKTTDVASTLNDVIEDFGCDMLKDNDTELQDLRVSTVEECLYLGRIRSDDGRLSQGNAFLEGDLEISGGHVVSLDLTDTDEYRLFPGQVVMVKGKNELGKCLRATQIVTSAAFPIPEILPMTTRPLNIIVACGPYTPDDSLQYEPLTDLLDVIKRDKPDLSILIGPFIDPSHPLIAAGEVADTFNDMFENMMDKIRQTLEDINTHVVLISSSKDAHHHPVYPTPPYSDPKKVATKISRFPDPSVLEVAGITIGVTSSDVLKHLANSEIAKSTITDRLGGLSKLILSQRNFYPLYPPDDSIPFDVQLWATYCKFSNTPHILILPSDLRHFIKEVDGTIVVNPERLTKGKSGGTYARIQVKLPEPLGEGIKSVADYCCGEIIKI